MTRRSADADLIAIEIRQLVRRFSSRSTAALQGIDLAVPAGAILGLVGPNGAGKTTLLNVLSTLLTPSSGSAVICGHDAVSDARMVRRLVGFAPDNARSFYGRLSARDNFRLFGPLRGLSAAVVAGRVEDLAERFGVRGFLDSPIQACSAGTRQKFNLMRALLHNPSVLLLDEPLQGIDAGSSESILKFLGAGWEARSAGAAILAVPRAEELPPICTHLAHLQDGRLRQPLTSVGVRSR